MFSQHKIAAVFAAAMMLVPAGCSAGLSRPSTQSAATHVAVTIETKAGDRRLLSVELARTSEEQARGLMYRTDLPADGGMLFAPYPGDGGPPREAQFWMYNTPSPLDVVFIRPDGTIARIAANAEPFSKARIPSGEPVSAVLEINGGRAAELGIAAGDRVSWDH